MIEPPTAAIVLAAGAASRMGQLKQTLPYRGSTLVGHAVDRAVRAGFSPIIVVVGAEAGSVRTALAGLPVFVAHNAEWQSGMGSSIVAGMRRLQTLETDPEAVAILLADQPLIQTSHLTAMRAHLRSGAAIVAARYNGTVGVPALFHRSLFGELASLDPAAGARSLLLRGGQSLIAFDLAEAATDIDTPSDFSALTS